MATSFDWKTQPLHRVAADHPVGTPGGKFPDPDLGTDRIPAARYTSADYMRREWERLWRKVWLIGPREELMLEAGDWVSHEIGTESFIFARQADGDIKGFFNVCPHRGNRLVPKDASGFSNSFRCSYHHWEWQTDGALKNIPDRETFPQLQGACALGLKEVRTDTWGGFFWFTMNRDGPAFRDYMGVIPAHLDPYRFEDMKLIDWKTIRWDCNWKTRSEERRVGKEC